MTFQAEHLGRSEFYIWYGQVVGGPEWEDNQKDEAISKHKIHTRDDVSGWGHRCKVAIMGYDPRLVNEDCVKNSELVMAETMVPTTGGGGIGGGVMTPSIGNNSFVVGFYKDGVSAREPVIMGVLPNVSQSRLKNYDYTEKVRYDAASGYKPSDPVANDALWLEGGVMETGEMVRPATLMLKAQLDDGKREFSLPQSYNCQKKMGPLEAVQLVLQEVANVLSLANAASGIGKASDALKNINAVITTATNVVSSYIRGLIQDMRSVVLNFLNREQQRILDLLPPNIRSLISFITTTPLLDELTCIFEAMLGDVRGLVGSFMGDFVGGLVNAGFGAAQSALGSVLTGTLGPIIGGVSGALGTIASVSSSVISAISDPVGLFGDIAGSLGIPGGISGIASAGLSALGLVFGALNLFSCKESLSCARVNAVSYLYGEVPFGFGAAGGGAGAGGGNTAGNNGGGNGNNGNGNNGNGNNGGGNNGGGGGAGGRRRRARNRKKLENKRTKNLSGIEAANISRENNNEEIIQQAIKDATKVDSGPILSGPPIISTSGGGNSQIIDIGNPVVSASGEILAVDLLDDIGKFTNRPNIIVTDPTGDGRGAVLVAILDDGSVIKFDLRGCGKPGEESILPDLSDPDNKTEYIGGGPLENNPLSGLTPYLICSDPQIPPEGRSIKKIVVIDSGVGYKQFADGSTGGGGQKFSDPEDTIVFCGGYNVYPPCVNVTVEKGNIVYLPLGTQTQVTNFNGDPIQTIVGRGPLDGTEILETGILATPCVTRDEVIPPQPGIDIPPSYDVTLTIGDVIIQDPGVGYDCKNDKIIIEPSNGAELVPVCDGDGSIIRIEIVSPGIGFTEFPEITIPSDTGVRASLIPVFDVIRASEYEERVSAGARLTPTGDGTSPIPTGDRIEDIIIPDTESVPTISEGIRFISVIDCVGIIPPKREFDILPE